MKSPEELIEGARQAAGRGSFGRFDPIEPLTALVESLEADAVLDVSGMAGAESQLHGLLVNALVVAEFLENHPEIGQRGLGEDIVIIAGGARTGTTLLHRLLGSDPETATMKAWQTMASMPARGTTASDPDPRAETMRQSFSRGGVAIHPMEADGAEEEVFYLQEALSCLLFELGWHIPGYETWLRTADLTQSYERMIDLIRLNEWRADTPEGRRRAMKSPQYAHDLGLVVEMFPTAKFVCTHRDPIRYVGSYLSIHRGTREGEYPGLDHRVRSEDRVGLLEYERAQVAEVRATQPADRFLDVLMGDVMADPIGTVGRIYDFAGWKLTGAAEEGIRRWVEANPRNKDGRHEYSLAEFGVDGADIERRFAGYRDEFGIPPE